jgi:Zn-dependent peptidase ImmA (M78 family)/DNA-binding XRE family transcriptional regulator
MFNGKRLSLARRRRGLSKKGFAEALQLHPRTVMRWEDGDRNPSDDEVSRIAAYLAFPEEFFSGDDVDESSVHAASFRVPSTSGGEDTGSAATGAVSFRSLSAMPARDRDAALAAGSIAYLLDDWVEQRFSLPVHDLDDLSHETPDGAARALREKWGIGERPISNMIHLLEAKGARVFSLAENTRTMDAFSVWRRDKPYVFLNCRKTPEHQRFDAAHELGHLVLHKHGGPDGREAEGEANAFASAFLMPADDVLAVIPRVRDLNQMISAKRRWRVSLAALNYRLHKLGITSEWQYRTFCIQLQDRGYRDAEPDGIPREISAVWQKVFDALRAEGMTKAHIAVELNLPPAEIENLVFGLINMLSVEGGAASSSKGRAHLKLVSG